MSCLYSLSTLRPVSDRKNVPMAVRGALLGLLWEHILKHMEQYLKLIFIDYYTTREAWPVVIATIVSFTICACTLLTSKLDLPTVRISPAWCSVVKWVCLM